MLQNSLNVFSEPFLARTKRVQICYDMVVGMTSNSFDVVGCKLYFNGLAREHHLCQHGACPELNSSQIFSSVTASNSFVTAGPSWAGEAGWWDPGVGITNAKHQ